jgi:hypothetical protein
MLFLMNMPIIVLHAWAIQQPYSANTKEYNRRIKTPILRHDDANNKKQQNLMAPNHLQKYILMRHPRLTRLG